MAEKKLVALALICVVLSAGIFGAIMVLNQKNIEMVIKNDQISGLENEKLTLETQIETLQSETTTLSSNVATLESQVSSLQTEAEKLENENDGLETQVSTLEANVSSLQSGIASLESLTQSLETQISSFQTEITALETEVIESFDAGYSEGETEGYQLGYDDGYIQGVEDSITAGWYLRDPTYNEAISFVNSDKTDENPYSSSYTCYSFTADFNENAFQAGYRCGFVYIEFSSSAHAIACFNTTDRGIIYIEPQTDEIVTLAVGQTYDDQASWGIITFFGIIW